MRRHSFNRLCSKGTPATILWEHVRPYGSKLGTKIPSSITSFRPLQNSRRKSPPNSARCGRARSFKTPASRSRTCKPPRKPSAQPSASQCTVSAPSSRPSPPRPSQSVSSTSSSSPSSASPSSCPSTSSSSPPAGRTRPSSSGSSS